MNHFSWALAISLLSQSAWAASYHVKCGDRTKPKQDRAVEAVETSEGMRVRLFSRRGFSWVESLEIAKKDDVTDIEVLLPSVQKGTLNRRLFGTQSFPGLDVTLTFRDGTTRQVRVDTLWFDVREMTRTHFTGRQEVNNEFVLWGLRDVGGKLPSAMEVATFPTWYCKDL